MKRISLYIIFFIITYVASYAKEPIVMESLLMHSKILNMPIRYSIVLPEDYHTSNKSYPVVYLLHGLGDNETSWLEYGRIDYRSHTATKQGEIIPMIYVMPQGFRTYYVNDYKNSFRYQDMFIKELIPFIDSLYRTKAGKEYRATMGYSMGGFGALILPLKNPNTISTSVPLSISIRTDEQYMTEESPWWDEQWGKIFGGENKKGKNRLTEYYKQNNPLYLLKQESTRKESINIYIDNGDDEETLSYSNEELHLTMLKNNVNHEYRIRNGGHSFLFWYSSLENALPFISDAFEGKKYRGDKKEIESKESVTKEQWKEFKINNKKYPVFVPKEYEETTRKYPVLYLLTTLNDKEKIEIGEIVQRQISLGNTPPFCILFYSTTELPTEEIITEFEKQFRARPGYRFRSIVGHKEGGRNALFAASNPKTFASCISIDANITAKDVADLTTPSNSNKPFNNAWLYIDVQSGSSFSEGNSYMHTTLKAKDIKHEYRVRENDNDFNYLKQGILQTLPFIGNSFHR